LIDASLIIHWFIHSSFHDPKKGQSK